MKEILKTKRRKVKNARNVAKKLTKNNNYENSRRKIIILKKPIRKNVPIDLPNNDEDKDTKDEYNTNSNAGSCSKKSKLRKEDILSDRMGIECLIFDFDGTLAETEEAHRNAFNKAFHSNKLNWHWDQHIYKKLLKVAGGIERIEFYNKSFFSHSKQISWKDIEEIHFQKTKFYSQLVSQGSVHLRPGIREFLKKAKYNKKKLAISTSTSRDNVTLLLRSCLNENPEDVFSFISTGDLVKKKKPSPDLYKLVLAEMNLMPEECLAFEDSRIGLISAKRANIKTAVNPSQYSKGDNFDEADYFLTSFFLEQFPKSLRKRLAL